MSSNQVNIGEAKPHLSRLLERVAAGEEIIISEANRPIARLVPLERARTPRRPGRFAGQIVVHDDFDAPLPEFEQAFYDGPRRAPPGVQLRGSVWRWRASPRS